MSLPAMLFHRIRETPRLPALRVRRGAGFVDVTFAAMGERIEALAAGFLSVPGGVDVGTSVALMGQTSASWLCADFAAMSLGAVTIPIYASLLGAEVGYILQDADVRVAVVDDKARFERVLSVLGGFHFFDVDYGAERLQLKHIIVIDPDGIDADVVLPAGVTWESLSALEARGRAALAADQSGASERASLPERRRRTSALNRDSLATITYTSGTTGAPKGVLQTHGNWLSLLDVAHTMQIFTEGTQKTGSFLFLPLAHAFGRLVAFGGVYFSTVTVISSPDTLLKDMVDSRPGFVPAAPRVYEKIYARLMATVAEMPKRRQQIFRWALNVGERTIPWRERQEALPPLLAAQMAIAERLVFRGLRARLGLDRVEVMLSGSAALSPTVLRFFLSLNIMLIEAYGLTETCPGISANRPDRFRVGTVGPVIPGIELRFEPDGEICVRGPNISKGYHRRPDANAEAFDPPEKGGYFHTGDIGVLDDDGFLRITDRKKDLIKTSGGKYVAPQKIEGLLKGRPFITDAVVIGDGRKYCTLLVVVDDDAINAAFARDGGGDRDAFVARSVRAQVDAINAELASFESIKDFRVVQTPFTVENGMLTASFKVKRKEVQKRYLALIDEMYVEGAHHGGSERR